MGSSFTRYSCSSIDGFKHLFPVLYIIQSQMNSVCQIYIELDFGLIIYRYRKHARNFE